MKHCLTIVFLTFCLAARPQRLVPAVINSSGGENTVSTSEGNVTVYYNIGEPIIDDVKDKDEKIRFTQGFLQPDIIGNGVLTVSGFSTGMTCASSNDASISLTINGFSPPFHLRWYKNGTQLRDTNSLQLNLSAGSYSYEVIDSKRNVRNGSIDIPESRENCRIVIHNGLSPNEDGHNDFFFIEHIGDYSGNRVSIYNRWGDLVWDGTNYDNNTVLWKGTDQSGRALSDGTYYFIIELEGSKTTGWVELIR